MLSYQLSIYTQIKFNLTSRFSYIGVICITLRITVQWQAITNTDNNEDNNNNINILSQEKHLRAILNKLNHKPIFEGTSHQRMTHRDVKKLWKVNIFLC